MARSLRDALVPRVEDRNYDKSYDAWEQTAKNEGVHYKRLADYRRMDVIHFAPELSPTGTRE